MLRGTAATACAATARGRDGRACVSAPDGRPGVLRAARACAAEQFPRRLRQLRQRRGERAERLQRRWHRAAIWSFQTGDKVRGSFDYYYAGSGGGGVYFTPRVYADAATSGAGAYVGSYDYNVIALDASSGAVAWKDARRSGT